MKEKSLKNLLPLLLAVVVMMLWGSLYPTVKLGYEKFEIDTAYYPNLLMFAGMRFTVSGALITLFLGVKNKAIPTVKSKKEWGGIALVALFAVILNYGCAFYGLSLVESSKTALLKQSGVLIFIVLCALIFKDDKMTVGKGVGAVLGLGSIIILNINQLGLSMGLGEAIIIASSFCTVTASVICKKLLKNTDSIVMTGYSQLLGGVVLLVIGLACGGSMRLKEFGDYALFGGGLPTTSPHISAVVDAYDTYLTRTVPTPLNETKRDLAATSVGSFALFGGGDCDISATKSATVYAYTVI